MVRMRILFIGCVESSYRLLSKLLEEKKNVVGVITKESSACNSDFVDISMLCRNSDIPFHYVKNVNDADSIAFIESTRADIGYCFGWSQLLNKELINIFPKGVIGFHPAALPNNRGRHPLIWALALGLKETASTFFMMNDRADEGAIISQRKVDITYEDDARTLYDKILNIAANQVVEFTDALENDTAAMIPQDMSQGNSWRKRGKTDGQIDWRMSSKSIYNLVRSLTKPYVGAYFVYIEQEYKVWRVQEIKLDRYENIEPGKVIGVYNDGTVDVKVGDGAIRLIDFDELKIRNGDYLI